jgi:hypothetical protein
MSGLFFLRVEESVAKHLISGFIAKIPLMGCLLLQKWTGKKIVKILLNLTLKRGSSQTFLESLITSAKSVDIIS